MLADIVIRAKGGQDRTATAIRSIRENTPAGTYRLVLVDDGSDPPLECDADVLVRYTPNRGAVTATNIGLAISLLSDESKYVVVMDNDIRVPEGDTGWLERFVAEIEEFPGTGAIGATTGFANPPQHILAVPVTYLADWHDKNRDRRGSAENPEIAPLVSFCCMMPKDVVRRVGLWDERYNPGNYEDTDYAMTLRARGYAVRVARSVYIHHDGHKTFGDGLSEMLKTNGQKFIEKWGPGRLADMGYISSQGRGAG